MQRSQACSSTSTRHRTAPVMKKHLFRSVSSVERLRTVRTAYSRHSTGKDLRYWENEAEKGSVSEKSLVILLRGSPEHGTAQPEEGGKEGDPLRSLPATPGCSSITTCTPSRAPGPLCSTQRPASVWPLFPFGISDHIHKLTPCKQRKGLQISVASLEYKTFTPF